MATGRPLRTEYDRTQNYKDYMKNLDIQIKNNKTNYDANILYKQTGIPTQPLDTRTYAEKHADIAQLKVNLRSELRLLLDDNVIGEVLRELNDDQIQFLAGVAPALIAELKPKYSVGMTAHHFIDILDKKVRQETDFSLPSEMMGTLADQLDTISNNMVTAGLMEELIDTVEHSKFIRTGENRQIVNFLRSINREIGQTQDLMNHISNIRSGEAAIAENYARAAGQEAIHTQDILATMNDKILNFQALEELLRGVSIENSEMTQEALVELFQHIPTIPQVEAMINQIQQADAQGDIRGLEGILQNVREEFATMSDRLDTYNDNVTDAIEAQQQQTAQVMGQIAAEGRRTRIDLGTSVAGVYDRVEQMNENINEGISGLRTDIRDNTAGLANSLANLYANVERNAVLLGDLQGGQIQIRETLQVIERAINMLQGLNEVNVTQLLDMEQRINDINNAVLRVGVRPETLDEIQGAIAVLDDEIREGRQEQRQGRVGIPLEQQQRNEYELIQRLRLRAEPVDEVVGYRITRMREYLMALLRVGIPQLNETMNAHIGGLRGDRVMSLGYIRALNGNDLEYLRNNYRFIDAEIQRILDAPPPIFAEAREAEEKAGERREAERGAPRVPPEELYRPVREVAPGVRPRDFLGEPRQMEEAPRAEGRGLLTGHRGVGVRMTGRGVAPKEKYIPLGKYLINIHKLEHNNIVSFKSPNHKSTNIQSKRVSQPVADILLHIVNGTLNEIVTDNLSEDDISYLFQLIKKCELDNFLDGKAEDKIKTKTEQEIHKFYVLQGEIVAGNDNPQLIREFKAILLTMMNENKLSKKEAGDVLIQMSLLGI
jgi:hypothetical protein